MSKFVRVMTACLCVVLACSLAYAREARLPRNPALIGRNRERLIDRREALQQKRIDHGIAKGYLTPDEVTKLATEEKAVADMEANFKADGKLSRDEMQQLRTGLNTASAHIWAEKHDTDGKQMPVYRLGKTVFAKKELTDMLEQDDLGGAQARLLIKDFHRAIVLKHKLATADLTPGQRTALQADYNDLLNKYFEVR